MRLLYALERSDLVARAALGSVKDLFVLNLHRATAAIAQQFWRRVPYRYVGYVASLVPSWNSFIAALNPTSAHDDVAQTHATFLLGEKMHRRHDERLWARKKCLEKSGYHGEPGLIAHIRDCGQTLRDYVAATCPGRPLIFAPLHTVSDRIAAAVCSLGPAGRATVVSAYAADALGKDEMHSVALLGTKLDRLMVADLKAAEFRRRIKAVSEGRSHLVVFPDALPEFTSAMAGRPCAPGRSTSSNDLADCMPAWKCFPRHPRRSLSTLRSTKPGDVCASTSWGASTGMALHRPGHP